MLNRIRWKEDHGTDHVIINGFIDIIYKQLFLKSWWWW